VALWRVLPQGDRHLHRHLVLGPLVENVFGEIKNANWTSVLSGSSASRNALRQGRGAQFWLHLSQAEQKRPQASGEDLKNRWRSRTMIGSISSSTTASARFRADAARNQHGRIALDHRRGTDPRTVTDHRTAIQQSLRQSWMPRGRPPQEPFRRLPRQSTACASCRRSTLRTNLKRTTMRQLEKCRAS